MHHSWFSRRRPGRGPAGLALVAAVAAIGAGSTAATATAAGKQCGTVAGETSDATWAHVEVEDVRGLSCAGARKIVRQCLKRERVRGWSRVPAHHGPGLRNGRRRIEIDAIGGELPNCVEHQRVRPSGRGVGLRAGDGGGDGGTVGAGSLGATSWGNAGPWQGPVQMPPTSRTSWNWVSPVVSSKSGMIDVSSADLYGAARTTGGAVRSVWFEYGKTRDLGKATDRLPPKVVANDDPWVFSQEIRDLDAGTRYYWRAMASVDADGGPKTLAGATGSFATAGYRRLTGPNPCQQTQFGKDSGGVTQVTEALAIVCSRKFEFVNSVGLPVSVGYSGRLSCPVEYPHNLNAGDAKVTIPKIDYEVQFNNIVNYWRSNDSARFTRFPGYQENYGGAEAGPLVGWHEWDVDQWGYLGSTSRTQAQMWINCTNNWKAFTPEQLARGEGNDKPSTAAPAMPRNFRFTQSGGDWNAAWEAPSAGEGGIAGYQLLVDSLEDSSTLAGVVLTDTDLRGSLSGAYVKAMSDIYRTKRLFAHVWTISGEGIRSTRSATIAITAP